MPVLCQFPDLLQVYLNGLQKVNIILQGFIPTKTKIASTAQNSSPMPGLVVVVPVLIFQFYEGLLTHLTTRRCSTTFNRFFCGIPQRGTVSLFMSSFRLCVVNLPVVIGRYEVLTDARCEIPVVAQAYPRMERTG